MSADALTLVRQRALGLLARREHSRAELTQKLSGVGTPAEVDAVLTHLSALDLQSDARMAESYVRAKAARLGSARLRYELKQRGISDELIAAALSCGIDETEDEYSRARAVWRGKFKAPPQDAREWSKHARFLAGRGFSPEIIRKILKEPFDDAT